MAQPNQPTPERAAQGAGKSIPIEDDRPADAKAQPQARPADASGSKETPSSDAAAAEAAPQGEAIEAEVIEDAGPSADEQVAQAKAEAQDWQDKYLRLHAEWDTYRRRTTEQREVEKARATEKLVTSLLPVIDDFERTIDYATKNGEGGLFDGVKAVHAKLVDVLKKDASRSSTRPAKRSTRWRRKRWPRWTMPACPTRRCPRYTNEVTRWERKFSGLQW